MRRRGTVAAHRLFWGGFQCPCDLDKIGLGQRPADGYIVSRHGECHPPGCGLFPGVDDGPVLGYFDECSSQLSRVEALEYLHQAAVGPIDRPRRLSSGRAIAITDAWA